ncbi:polysaccharide biosynthesis tyrosine autokinase [candidate division WOR-3 bacterium]|nr:polysaccharide biosynthesis tyrosine autokinase [candidate division WOR-3 bacterium]
MDRELDRELDIQDYFRIIKRRLWIILGVVGFSIVFAFLYLFYSPPLYSSSSTILVKKIETIFGGGYFSSPTEEELTNHIYLLKSDPVLRKTSMSFSEEDLSKMEFNTNHEALRRIKRNIKNGRIEIGVEGETRIINIRVTEANPYRTFLIANKLALVYRDFDIEMKREDIHSTYSFIENQTRLVKADLEEAESRLRSFKEKYGVLGVSAEVEGFVNQMADIEMECKKASIEAEVLQKELASIESRLSESEKRLLLETSKTSYKILLDLKDQLTSLENQRADLLIQGYSSDDQKIQQMENAIRSLRKKMDELIGDLMKERGILDPLEEMENLFQKSLHLSMDIAVAEARKEAFDNVLSYYRKKLNEIPKRDLMLARLTREKEANEKIYMMLLEKKEQAQISEVSERGDIFILDLANMPEKPNIISKVKKGILFIILGIFFGVGIAFLVDYIDSAIRGEGDILRITGLPVLASLPIIDGNNDEKVFILSDKNLSSPIAEAFRRLRTNIKLSRADGMPSSILITGPDQGCGKSTIAINLSLSFASIGKKVLLVDSDLRKPSIGSYLGISDENGLTDLLVDPEGKASVFDFNGVDVISAGSLPPNPSELLDSERMRGLLRKWEKAYDLLILDSPPLLSVSDSCILANEVEETIVVVAYGKTRRGMIHHTAELLDRLSIKTLGFVINKMHIGKEYGYYSYYSYYRKED